jgi:hypothetical protein
VEVLAQDLLELYLVIVTDGRECTLDRRNHFLRFSDQANSFGRFGEW